MSELVRIPFHGSEILAVNVDGKPYVILKKVIESLGLEWSSQLRKLKSKSWASTILNLNIQVPGDVQARETVLVTERVLLMLLATIDEHRVDESVRPLLVSYQSEVADALESYWLAGGAINPRASVEQLAVLERQVQHQVRMWQLEEREAEMRVLRASDGIVDPAWLDAKGRHVAARALGEEPEIDPSTRPLSVGEFLSDMGVGSGEQRRISSTFGKRVKAAYRKAYATEPPVVDRFIDGTMRRVAGYTEAYRDIFDSVWKQYYADKQ